jgi:uncharacterized protein (TIGR02231 family)
MTTVAGRIEHHPAVDETRLPITLPVCAATLLEDRAQVTRAGTIDVVAGRNRLVVWDVAPVLQDVSLRASTTTAGVRIDDARVRRAVRVQHHELPDAARVLEDLLVELGEQQQEQHDELARLQQRAGVIDEMMTKALQEVPEDAAWSIGDSETWKSTFETLSSTSRQLLADRQRVGRELRKTTEALEHVAAQRALFDSPSHRVLALVELDVVAERAGSVELSVEYTVPNAMWRPTHEAALKGGELRLTSRAAVWQNTGEDWNRIALSFSTARSSLGHEPPILHDDTLSIARKEQRVVVAAREVTVSSAGAGRGGGSGAAARGIELPGVDDGGDIQHLKAAHPVTVPSDGRPCIVTISSSTAPAHTSLVVMAEVEPQAVLKAVATHTGMQPLLAGPVDLLRESGPAGSTRTLFIAPGERCELGFGPDDDVRVQRRTWDSEQVDEVDQWHRRTIVVDLALSNLGGDAKQIEIVERVPVSEIEHVKVSVDGDRTTAGFRIDVDGFVRWAIELPSHDVKRVMLVSVIAYAPGVSAA